MQDANNRTNLRLTFADHPETTLRIGSADYTLRLLHGELTIDDYTVMGFCDFEKQIIGISDRQPVKRRWRTFWHEFMHACQVELVHSQRPLQFEEVAELVEQAIGWIDTSIMSRIGHVLTMPTSSLLPDDDDDSSEVIIDGQRMKPRAAKR